MTGKEARAIRRTVGLTQVEFAAVLGISTRALIRIEKETGAIERLTEFAILWVESQADEKTPLAAACPQAKLFRLISVG